MIKKTKFLLSVILLICIILMNILPSITLFANDSIYNNESIASSSNASIASPSNAMLTPAASEKSLSIEMRQKGSMLENYNFYFFNVRVGTGIFFWETNDGRPIFCVQKDSPLLDGLKGTEITEEYGQNKLFGKEQYELISIVLQSFGMNSEDVVDMTPGEYLAGQSTIWAIQTGYWKDTDYLKEQMEYVYENVKDWNEYSAEEIIDDSRQMIDVICEAIDNNYGSDNPFIPSFASKYENKAPKYETTWENDICSISFSLDDKDESIKDFVFELPNGWNYRWEEDKITFYSETADMGTFMVKGYAPDNSELSNKCMPIGLMYIIYPSSYPNFQHLTSGVEITEPWSCYFQLQVNVNPNIDLSQYYNVPEVNYYKHTEDFNVIYGAEVEKIDGYNNKVLQGAIFQPLEYFDSSQLDDTILDKSQFDIWDGWIAKCDEQKTEENGKLTHTDLKTYHYEKIYCGGHPEPEIYYDGNSEDMRNAIVDEAWSKWEEEVEKCKQTCDFHSINGTAIEELEYARNLTYQQFSNLTYGYSFKEVSPPENYLLSEETENIQVFTKPFTISIEGPESINNNENSTENMFYLDSQLPEISIETPETFNWEIIQIKNYREKPSITISKQDITTKEELPGAQLTVTMENTVIDSWVSTDTPHVITELEDGVYTLTEVTAPDGYEKAESIEFTVIDGKVSSDVVVMYDAPEDTYVYISKQDITNNKELPGATLQIVKDGTVIEEWVSTDTPHVIENLADGTYTLVEITAPNGYQVAESITFEVVDGKTTANPIVMYDTPETTSIYISKQDATTKKELPGATLQLIKDGVVVDEWVSTDTPHIIENPADGTYTLVEITAPNGYKVAESITFEVVDGKTSPNSIVMYDEANVATPSEPDKPTTEEPDKPVNPDDEHDNVSTPSNIEKPINGGYSGYNEPTDSIQYEDKSIKENTNQTIINEPSNNNQEKEIEKNDNTNQTTPRANTTIFPKTGDDLFIFITISICSLVGIFLLLKIKRKSF